MNTGLGVLISRLGDNSETVKAIKNSLNKKLASLQLSQVKIAPWPPDELILTFTDGTAIRIFDDGQSCCESRYMTTDDDLEYYVGSLFLDITVKEGPTTGDEYDDPHETQFLVIKTSLGEFTMVTHNEHNGYYGGFEVCAARITPEDD